MDTAVLCTIAKNEFPYIDEWIQYHLTIGFDHIYIYDNEDTDVSPMMTRMDIYKDKVTVIPFKGHCQQMNAYYHFLQNYRTQHTWVGYIDVDEFIVLRKFPYITIHDLLRTHCTSGALALNWVLFGSNDKETYEPFPVVSRFIRRQKGVNEHIKWIVRISDIQYMVSPHHGVLWFGYAHDCHGTIVNGPYNPQGTDDVACIHHYFTKSKEEFLLKCKRGRADIPEFREFERDFYRHDCNEIEDTTAWEIFNGKK